jgi:hypothetical protein
MAWTSNGIPRPRRRRGDRRPPKPQAAAHATDRLAEPPAADPWLVLTREIDRCRRYSHPLALLRVTVQEEPSGPTSLAARPRREGRPSRRRREPLAALADALRDAVRSGDVAWVHGRAVFVLAPETDAFAAHAMGARVGAIAATVIDAPVDLAIAAFPEDGLTSHALRARLSGRRKRFNAGGAGRAVANGAPAWAPGPRVAHAPELREQAD